MKSIFRKAAYKTITFLANRDKLMYLLASHVEKVLLGFERGNYLYDVGWTKSIVENRVVNLAGQPIPWLTYPFVQFIENRLNTALEVFEFGGGNSTLYYAARTAAVYCIEHDEFWYNKIKNEMPENVKLFHSEMETGGAYCKFAANSGKQYDIIVVDGEDRINCCLNNLAALKPGGVVVLDDVERTAYAPGVNFLTEAGFKRIDFWGTAPTIDYMKCTTLFYRTNNCLAV